MKSNIQVKFLSQDEMAKARDIDWRYEHVTDDNLGFADKKKNRIFVRAGLDPELTKYLVDHELSHLFELEGTHEDENGIRHKGGGGFWRVAIPIAVAIAGTALGGWGVPAALGTMGLGGAAGLTGGGLALATGAGAGLGNFAGSTLGQVATGQKPDWVGNAIGGAAAGVGAGVTSGMSGAGIFGKGFGKAGHFSQGSAGSGWGGTGYWGQTALNPLAGGASLTGTVAGLGASGALGMGRNLLAPKMGGYGGQYGGTFMTGRSSGQPPIPRPSYGFGQEGMMAPGDMGTGGRGGKDIPGAGKGIPHIGIKPEAVQMAKQGMDKMFSKQSFDPSAATGFQQGAIRIA